METTWHPSLDNETTCFVLWWRWWHVGMRGELVAMDYDGLGGGVAAHERGGCMYIVALSEFLIRCEEWGWRFCKTQQRGRWISFDKSRGCPPGICSRLLPGQPRTQRCRDCSHVRRGERASNFLTGGSLDTCIIWLSPPPALYGWAPLHRGD